MSTKLLIVIAIVVGSFFILGLMVKFALSILNSIDDRKRRKHQEKIDRINAYKKSMKEDFDEYFTITQQIKKSEMGLHDK